MFLLLFDNLIQYNTDNQINKQFIIKLRTYQYKFIQQKHQTRR